MATGQERFCLPGCLGKYLGGALVMAGTPTQQPTLVVLLSEELVKKRYQNSTHLGTREI